MTVTLVQSKALGGSAGAVATGFSSATTAGNLLLGGIAIYKSGAVAPSSWVTSPPAGWTLVASGAVQDSTDNLWEAIYLYAKIADGTEGSTAFSLTQAGTSWRAQVEEVSGPTSATADVVSAVATAVNPATSVSTSLTTTKTDAWVYSLAATRAGSAPTITWSGGATALDTNENSNGIASAGQIVASPGAVSPAASLSTNEATLLVSAAFPQADSVAGGGGTTTGYVKMWNGSAWVRHPVKVWDGTTWTRRPVKFRSSSGSWFEANS